MFNSCLKENGSKFDLHALVVMPDHAHLLLSPLRAPDGWSFSLPQIMHAIQGASAREINLLLDRRGPVWQEEFFDHVLRSNDSLARRQITFARIRFERDWSRKSLNIPGCGGRPFRSSKHCGLSGRLTRSETRSHTGSAVPHNPGNHAVSTFRHVSLLPDLGDMS